MKINFKKTASKLSVFLFILAIFPMSVSALGLVTEPISIENALRGGEYQDTLIIVNTESKITKITLQADGQIADWVKFYKTNDLDNPVEEIEVPAKEKMNIIAIFTVPADSANGKYEGAVTVTTKPAASEVENQSYSSVAQRIDREVAIKVTDTENINLAVSVIPKAYDIKPGDPLVIRFIYDNQGNVSLAPQIDLKIKNDINTVQNVIYPYPNGESFVKPLSQHEIPAIEVPTSGFAEGKYRAEINFLHNGQSILEKDFGFTIRDDVKVLGWAGKIKDYGWVKIAYNGLYVLAVLFILIIAYFFNKARKLKKIN